MDLGISGKVALLPASSRGIGKAVALELAREGVNVALCGRDPEALSAAVKDVSEIAAARVFSYVADLSDPVASASFVHAAQAALGPIDILVLNGGGPPPGIFDQIQDAAWTRAIDETLLSPMRMVREVLPHMKARKWGRIIMISSYSIKQPIPNMMLSNSVRMAVLGWAKTLAAEVASEGITVNTVCPGWTLTKRVETLIETQVKMGGGSYDEIAQSIVADIPVGRLGMPEEIAALVAFLASSRAGYMTGTAITADGGIVKSLLMITSFSIASNAAMKMIYFFYQEQKY